MEIAREIGDRAGEGRAYHNIGSGYVCLKQFEGVVDNFVSAVETFNTLRSGLKAKYNQKINFRKLREMTYTALWRSFRRIGKIDDAFLLAAEQGRAQTL